MNLRTDRRVTLLAWILAPAALAAPPLSGQGVALDGTPYETMTGEQLYQATCANCHGVDGAGVPQNKLGFDIPPADFSDCRFAAREPDADWIGIAHEGGPFRGFSHFMPAFGEALSVDQLTQVMAYVRTLCDNTSWPRGELNMPRAMVTEKAYPEDELVWTTEAALEGPGVWMNEIVYEKRVGPRGQIEVVVPFGFQEQAVDGTADWQGGLGDVVLGYKHAVFHSSKSGSILSGGLEMKLPTGKEERGFGTGTSVFETFVSYGQLLPVNSFVQLQGIVELPFDQDLAGNEVALRMAVGTSFTQGRWGRAWTPMLEVLAGRELESDAATHWDLVPQFQVTLNRRQHVMANVAVRVPINDTAARHAQLLVYFLWDWFDGGLFDGW